MERTLKQSASAVLLPAIAITDGELLMRYARHGDEAAFATLVEKHGRLVWTVCWQVLRHHQEIEDAFQSTFFILAKRANSIRSCDSLCGWLYRVAYRTALRSRMASKPKPMSELVADTESLKVGSSLDHKLQAIEQYEQRSLLLEELQSLPEKYQQPLVLCYLEGKSRRAIAEELGCSLETIKGRLARGRQVLRHRLIRRGVSLSLAMGAMAVPIKFAAAAVTPQLVGVTVAGSAAWAAGVVTVASTVSSQVLHLAHQGTVAMTIATFAKPAVLAVALLSAASATLAVNSTDQAPVTEGSQVVNLQAEAEAASASANDEEAVEIVVATEVVESDPQIVPSATEKPRQPAPLRSPKPVVNYPEVMVPSQRIVTEFSVPSQFVDPGQPFNLRVPEPQALKMQMKVAELESKVAHLQLESKKLEIAAFGEIGKKKEELLNEAKKRLLMAEAEQLKMHIEQQQAQIHELAKAVEQQARGVAVQAAQGAIQAQQFAQQPQEATIVWPSAPIAQSDRYESDPKQAQESSILQKGDQIKIEVVGAFPDRPIHDVYTIEPMGTVALGATYGRVKVIGLSVLDAEKAIVAELSDLFSDPLQVQVTIVGRNAGEYWGGGEYGGGAYGGGGGYGRGYGGSKTTKPTRQPQPERTAP